MHPIILSSLSFTLLENVPPFRIKSTLSNHSRNSFTLILRVYVLHNLKILLPSCLIYIWGNFDLWLCVTVLYPLVVSLPSAGL